MGAPGPARLFRVFLSADCLGARSPGRFSGFSHQPVGRSGNSLWARCRIWVKTGRGGASTLLLLCPQQRTSTGFLDAARPSTVTIKIEGLFSRYHPSTQPPCRALPSFAPQPLQLRGLQIRRLDVYPDTLQSPAPHR